MRRLLCIALLLLCCAYGCIAADVVQTLPQKGKASWEAYTVSAPESDQLKKKKSFEPIRFAVSAKEIDRVLAYCGKDKVDERSSWDEQKDTGEYGFEFKIAEEESDLCDEDGGNGVKPETKKMLLREVLPAALKLHSERLKVERVKGNLTIKEKDTHPYLPKCPNASIPKEHLNGIPNADFMLYVGVTEDPKPVQICSNNENGRPTSALIRFVSKEIAETRHFIRFAAHEVAHALGFEIETMKKYDVIEGEKVTGNKKVPLLKSKSVIQKMKDHYNCSNNEEGIDEVIRGLAFENDADKSAPLHWERRIAKDELMSTYTDDLDVTGAYYSALTLAIFDSMPFYKADFDMAESMSWGKDAGCNVLRGEERDKETIIQNHSDMFCEGKELVLECTSDRFALGRCTRPTKEVWEKMPDEFSQFSEIPGTNDFTNDLTDGYPIIKPIHMTNCEAGKEEYMPGSLLGNTSRCLTVKDPKMKVPTEEGLIVRGVCAHVKCEDNKKVMIQFKGSKDWYDCTNGGKNDNLKGTQFEGGEILCPKYSEVCTDLKSSNDFPIVYDEDEKREMDEEQRKMEEEQRELEEEERKRMEEEEEEEEEVQKDSTVSQQEPQSSPQTGPKGDMPSPKDDIPEAEKVPPPAAEVRKPQEDSPAEDEKRDAPSPPESPPTAASPTEPHAEKEGKNQDESSNGIKDGSLQQERTPLAPEKTPGVPVKTPEGEKRPNSETSTQGNSELTGAAVGDTPSTNNENQKHTTGGIGETHAKVADNHPKEENNAQGNPTDNSIHSESAAHSVGENRDHTVSTGSNAINTTTTGDNTSGNAQTKNPTKATEGQVTASEPVSGTQPIIDVKQNPNNSNNTNGNTINTTENSTEKNTNTPAPAPTPTQPQSNVPSSNSSSNNVTTSSKKVNTPNVDAPATVKGLNDTQMGQVMNNVSVIVVGGGADSSITASYQFSLLLLVCALVALASP